MTPFLVHQLLTQSARRLPESPALVHKNRRLNYAQLAQAVAQAAAGLRAQGLERGQRVAIYLPKQPETIEALLATSLAGGIFVPVNPVLKPPQVAHILADSEASMLVTSRARAHQLEDSLRQLPALRTLVLVDAEQYTPADAQVPWKTLGWQPLKDRRTACARPLSLTDTDTAAILYTSGSTGRPKGVVLSHRNLMAGAESVASYLHNSTEDRILALLPLSFDAGLSQITTAFASGACCHLLDFLLPADVKRLVAREAITGLTAVPPLWHQLAALDWSDGSGASLRYFANTGGHMPASLLAKLRGAFPQAAPYLMYGLTEAFRSTYLEPDQIDIRPDSIGQAIPNAEVLVLREDGSECENEEVGELVHRGPLVSQGYWKDAERTAERFRFLPRREEGALFAERAVWSGDQVRRDAEGYLYFVGRRDDMIKTSGYRVSPGEIEEVLYRSRLLDEVVALGVPHPTLGQAILVLGHAKDSPAALAAEILALCRRELPNFMVPQQCLLVDNPLPRNPNGKFDRSRLKQNYSDLFMATATKAPDPGT